MTRSQKALAGFFAFAGAMHFVIPRSYEAIVPPSFPKAREAVAVSGVAEVVGGATMLGRSTRRFARWWLLGLLLAVFPANVSHGGEPGAGQGPRPESHPSLGPVGAPPPAAAGDVVGLARNPRLIRI
jgi:hypothetical protein